VTDTAVEEQLARLQEQKAAWIPVEGEKPAPLTKKEQRTAARHAEAFLQRLKEQQETPFPLNHLAEVAG